NAACGQLVLMVYKVTAVYKSYYYWMDKDRNYLKIKIAYEIRISIYGKDL
nr:hypothetical protein [Tanacetum cinerariifolium]